MTRKDYLRIVEDLAVAVNQATAMHDCDTDQARAFASHFAHAFAYSEQRENSRFDANRFYAAVEKATGARMGVTK